MPKEHKRGGWNAERVCVDAQEINVQWRELCSGRPSRPVKVWDDFFFCGVSMMRERIMKDRIERGGGYFERKLEQVTDTAAKKNSHIVRKIDSRGGGGGIAGGI